MRKAAALALAGLLALVAAAWTSRTTPAATTAGCLQQQTPPTVKSGQLTIGTDNPAYPPWFGGGTPKGSKWKINDPASGKGFESAVAYAVATKLGFGRA